MRCATGDAEVLELGATLRGYGLYNGGSLALTDAAVCVAIGMATLAWLRRSGNRLATPRPEAGALEEHL